MTVVHHLGTLNAASYGLVLHIGAGSGAQIPSYVEMGFSNIVAVEANPDYAADLTALATAHARVQVVQAALGAHSGKVPFHVLNAADYSTLKNPEGLNAFQPGIKVAERTEVKAISAQDLVRLLPAPQEGTTDVLVLEAAGSEADIVQALGTAQALERFGCLLISCPRDRYFDDALSGPQLVQHLASRGFVLIDCDGQEDPDWPVYFFQLDVTVIENRKLKEELAALQTRLNSATATATVTDAAHHDAIKEMRRQQDVVHAELSKTQADFAQATQEAQKAHEAAMAQTGAQRDAARAELSKVHATLTQVQQSTQAAQTAHATALSQAHSQRDTARKALDDLRTDHETFRQERNVLQARVDEATVNSQAAQEAQGVALAELRTQRDTAQANLDTATQTAKDAQQSAATQRSDLALALRMQTIARQDHQDLQGRYDAIRREKEQLEHLLVKLTQKLGSAADHLRLMAAPSSEVVQDVAVEHATSNAAAPRKATAGKSAPAKATSTKKTSNKTAPDKTRTAKTALATAPRAKAKPAAKPGKAT